MATWQPPRRAARPLQVGDLRAIRIAAVVAAILIVGALVVRGSLGLSREQAERVVRTDPVTGLIVDGSAGLHADATAPLFDDVHLAPGDTATACVRVDYAGDTDPDAVALELVDLDGSSALARELQVVVERGDVTEEQLGCEAFRADVQVGGGRLDVLAAGPEVTDAWERWDPPSGVDRTWYRVSVTLDTHAADAVQGTTAGTDFVWSALADPSATSWARRGLLLATAVARDAALPLLALVVIAVLFLGIQDRIDRRDPKLALAPLTPEPRTFAPRTADAPTAPAPTVPTTVAAPISVGGTT